jgi:hypothetical protein
LRPVARDMSNREVAEALVLSGHTVHRHVANVLGKLGASSRTAAVAWAPGLLWGRRAGPNPLARLGHILTRPEHGTDGRSRLLPLPLQ